MYALNRRSLLSFLVAAALIWLPPFVGRAAGGKGKGLCAAAASNGHAAPYLAVLSAFPAELAPLLAAAEIETTVQVGARSFHLGRLGGVRVVLGLLGIGMVNATTTTRTVLANFPVAGLIVSGVAGSPSRIGDVVVPTDWVERDNQRPFRANLALLALAERAQTALPAALERCTAVPPGATDSHLVCMAYDPTVIFGGTGESGDDFGGIALPCTPGGGDIFGCELEAAPAVTDMETAAVAHVLTHRRVPFLGVRAVSDGAGDPLGDRGFPAQFFAYYRLAADNASVVTRAVVAELGRLAGDTASRRTCRLLAQRHWHRAAERIAPPNG